jgi:hypothetical protein
LIFEPGLCAAPQLTNEQVNTTLSVGEEFNALRLETALVKSRAEFDKYMKDATSSASPLNKLTPENKATFINSLTFNERGLTSLSYHALEADLTPTEIYKLTALLGMPHLTSLMQNAKPVTELDRLLPAEGASRNAAGQLKAGNGLRNKLPGFGDFEGYWCISRATCEQKQGSICTSNC